MNVYRQISVKVGTVKVSPFISSETSALQPSSIVQASPALVFDSGPGFESKPLELDLRNLPSIDYPELDSSLRNLLMESMRSSSTVNEDNDDAASEISACSSVVTLETVEEGESGTVATGHRKTSRTSSFTAGSKARTSEGSTSSYHSSSEAEEEDGRMAAMRKKSAKKISDLFTFNTSSSSGNGAIGQEESDEPKPPPGERRRKLSITRRISPLSLHGIFAGNQSASANKQEAIVEKPETNKKTRKLSLTMFNKPSTEKERKRRNTDPELPPNQQTSITMENEEKKNKENTASGRKESQTKPVPEQALFKEEDVKIQDLIKHVLRAHMLSMKEYKREACDRVCKSICRILKTLVASMKAADNVPQCKVVCQAYIGSVREEGLFASVQTLWENEKDNFAAASFRNDSLFGFASVITASLY